MSPFYPPSLSGLSEREAISEALYRAAIGSDYHDAELFSSAWTGEDVSMELHDDNKRVLPNLSLIRTHVLDKVGPMDTTRNIGMVKVNVKPGADTATLTATSTAVQSSPGKGRDPEGPNTPLAASTWSS